MRDGPILVTGGAGFIGSNLVDRLAGDGRDVVVLDSLTRPGVEANLAWLERRHGRRVRRLRADIRDEGLVAAAVGDAGAVFHFAAQVAVTASLTDPRHDGEVNITGSLNVLEAARRRSEPPPVIFASTNKVYGALDDLAVACDGRRYGPVDPAVREVGVSEARRLDFHTPYGCSKGAADQYVLDYWRSFGVPTCVMRMSCIYGPRQMGTEDQGWVAHFLIRALQGRGVKIFGDGRQVRDILHVRDAVEAYLRALSCIDKVSGRAFNLGGGVDNAVTLLDVIASIDEIVGRRTQVSFHPWRQGDQRYYVSDVRRVSQALDLPAPLDWREGLRDLASWLTAESPVLAQATAGAAE
ncbi:MAG: NAD-dependent epimerase/dehydratase family protein [Phenylobacterium sp.]|uniref:NAD-dependent epimerase/dehydratase family protein n=1 Tax=Phenylobacterium sp. TaxID=1871053 RepID=UPI00391CD5D4